MDNAFGLSNIVRGQEMIEEFITKKLYPTDTPDDVAIYPVAISAMTTDLDWRVIYGTNLPDEMLYVVEQNRVDHEPVLIAYKRLDLNEE